MAETYLTSGDYFWNAGMFIAKASVLLDELAATQPEMHAGLMELADAWDTPERGHVVDRVWPGLTKIALDYSVAEPAAAKGRLVVVPGEFDWDDLGDFASIAKLHLSGHKTDLAILGEGARVLSDSANGIVVAESGRTIALVGVTDIVVVDTPDALLVTTIAHAQRVKNVVDALRLAGRDDVL
jgi:mannose-1-phosphate guanylyltransferase